VKIPAVWREYDTEPKNLNSVALETYRKKRKFDVTPEPRGRKGPAGGHRYVIQKHAARRLHYDLRLELDGVMKSWAVTRGPSLDPNEKRLAVQVEDHPIEYNSFEGTIPEGEYGGGTVMVWDRGTWAAEGDPHKALAKGHLIFDLDGEKLHGRWHLVRMRARSGDRHDNWLLIKGKDEDARGPRDPDILEEQSRSAVSGRSIEEIAAGKGKKRVWHSNRPNAESAAGKAEDGTSFKQKIRQITAGARTRSRSKAKTKPRTAKAPAKAGAKGGASDKPKAARSAKAKPPPDFVPVSLATLYDRAPSGADWLHEIKFDGYRIEARLDGGKVRLLTRKQQNWTHRFTRVAEAVAALPAATALLDGEIVVEDEHGISNFSLLQTDLKDGRTDRFVYYAFDLLYLDGRDLTGEPLLERKAALAKLLGRRAKNETGSGIIRYTGDFDESGPVILRHACEMGLEGIVSKRRSAPYRSGRTDNFIKTKCRGEQEFIVAGFAPATAMPRAIGALIVAVYENGEFRYAGRVGTGYTQKMAHDLFKRLSPLRVERRPLELPADEKRKDVVWVEPKLVIEAEFAGITHGGVLRQASFKGIREDKPAEEVVREVPALRPAGAAKAGAARSKAAQGDAAPGARSAVRVASARARSSMSTKKSAGSSSAGAIRLTHPDRVYWPDVGVTKQQLAAYYVSVWDWIKPHIQGRALSLVRAPEGVGGETFFQKHIAANVKSSRLRRAVPGKDHDVIAVETVDDLVEVVQSGGLEIHVRGSRLDSLETCDRIVFDLDPGEGVAWAQIVAAAREIRDRLAAERLESFVKLSGGKGIHVVVPTDDVDWDAAKDFSGRIAARMAADSPKLYLAKMTKALRGGRIFIDYFRNSREATSIAPYSTRARAGAPVSAPLTWERLSRTGGGNDFTVLDLKKRLKEDAWAEIGRVRQKLPSLAKQKL
jgi:bifunctional non-homologous end joining protein LigD